MALYQTYSDFNQAVQFEQKTGFPLEPTQVSSVERCTYWSRLGNFSDVGCGKTVMSTATSMMKGFTTTLVIVPPILIPQWVEWLQRFTDSVVKYKGTPKKRHQMELRGKRWIVVSHAIFRQDFDRFMRELYSEKLELIVDEAHALKNPSSVLYKCVTKLGLGHDIQLLTGTPTNKPMDGYAYIKIKTPEIYRSVGHFENLHVAERDFFKAPTAYQNLDMLATNLALQTVRHTKEEVFGYNLQPIYQVIPYDLEPDHAALYDRLVDDRLLLLDDGSKIDATTAQRLYHALQQIVCNFGHFSGRAESRSAIHDLLDTTIESLGTCTSSAASKFIIWTNYKMTSRGITAYLNDKWPGSTVAAYSEVDADKSIELFMKDPGTRILVAQPQSAGMGLNPAHLCSEMMFIEATTVPLYMKQSIGRVDRKGQRVRPTIRFAQANGTIQRHLFNQLLNNDDLVAKVEGLKTRLRDILHGR